VVGVYFG